MAEQLIVNFEFRANQSFQSFFPADNLEVIAQLQASCVGQGEFLIYLWGAQGLGKTHLLQASCKHAHQLKRSVFYIDLAQTALTDPELLTGLDAYDLVCLDNINAIAGIESWEHSVFHFFNLPRTELQRLIVAADCAPANLNIQLKDLKTRLSWGLSLKLQEFSEADTIDALHFKAKQMGFALSTAAAKYLLSHYDRDWPSLSRLLEKLDRASLAEQRKLTLAFVKKVLMSS